MKKVSARSAFNAPHRLLAGLFILIVLFAVAAPAAAQHFGRNKVQYDKFDFKILATEHFDIYYYPVEAAAAAEAGRMAERWYGRLSRLLGHNLTGRQAVVLYASHPDFEQTNVIEGQLDEGTGGVTESARRRVVLPMAATLPDSDHVLGHELVHAFQYDMLGRNIEGLPLWFVEGMAEYLSLGPRDTQTAMWLRDAAIEDRLPKLASLDDPRFFPYRFGHALWAYVGGRLGDRVIGEIMRALVPVDGPGQVTSVDAVSIIESAFNDKREVISENWHNAIREAYGVKAAPSPKTPPTDYAVIGQRTGYGTLNVGPSLSPDGKRIAFLSARDLLSIDLFVANAETGRDAKKIVHTAGDPHFESLQFLASAGTWAPDNRRLAVAAVRKGKPVLGIIDADRADVLEEIGVGDLGEIFQPSWSPDGKSIAFSAQVGGVTDLFIYDFATKATRRLTNDAHGDLQPSWSPDGQKLVFVTDRYRGDLAKLQFDGSSLATIEVASGTVTPLENGLTTGRVIDPKWTPDGKWIYFVSDARGTPNVYRLNLSTSKSEQITDVETGIAGITPTSPALSMAANGSRFAMSLFVNGGHEIQFLLPQRIQVVAEEASTRDQGALPPARKDSAVAAELAEPARDLPAAETFTEEEYKPQFGLVAVGQQIGVASNSFGTFMSGGIAFQFSDILGNHVLSTTFDINGTVRDIGASASYLNRTHRWNWGVFAERAPYTSGNVRSGFGTVNGRPVYIEQLELYRQTYTQAGALLAYPLSRTSRVEVSSSVSHIGFSGDLETRYYDPNSGEFLGEESQDLEAMAGIRLFDVKGAYVRDTATFGATSPVLGQRLRFEVAPTTGDLKMTNVTLDFRQYLMPVRPVTFAFRGLHVARYGGSAEDERLVPMFIGYSTLVRGYDPNSFQVTECTVTPTGSCVEFDRLSGSRMAVVNGEVRIPAFGLKSRQMNYGPLPLELFGFFDGGVAWTRSERPSFANGTRDWVSSAGFGARVNLLGFLIAEMNMARPLNRAGRGWMFVFNMRPGF